MWRSDKETLSLWCGRERPLFSYPVLHEDTVADVCIVGAGIAGMTAAYLLAREGMRVVVLDAWDLAAGESQRSTAHMTAMLDERYADLTSSFGGGTAQLIAESHLAAINRVEAIVREEGIDCGFERVDGYLAAGTPERGEELQEEAQAAYEAGFADRLLLGSLPVEGAKMLGPALRIPQQAMIDPLRYLKGLADAVVRRGGHIYSGSPVQHMHDRIPVETETARGFKVHSSSAIVATHTPINDRVTIHTKQAAYRTYVIALEVPKNSVAPFLLWDMEDPYHYVRLARDSTADYLIVGGEDHKTGQANDSENRYAALEAWTRRHFPIAGAVSHRWSGQVMEPVDGLAFIGRNPGDKNVYIATGFSGTGTTYGTISGLLLRDLIIGRENAWADIYDPSRKAFGAAAEYLRENANAVACMARDWAGPGEAESIEDIRPGHGAILREGLHKVAVYRDEDGEVQKCSATCTHLGCVVQWNGGEKSWDCPCHGSRFGTQGQVLHGPAGRPLSAEAGDAAPQGVGQEAHYRPRPSGDAAFARDQQS